MRIICRDQFVMSSYVDDCYCLAQNCGCVIGARLVENGILSSAESGPATAYYFTQMFEPRCNILSNVRSMLCRGSNIRVEVIGRYPDQNLGVNLSDRLYSVDLDSAESCWWVLQR